MNINNKLFIGFGLLIIVSIFAISQLYTLSDLAIKLYKHPFTINNTLHRIDSDLAKIKHSLKLIEFNNPALQNNLLLEEQTIIQNENEIYNHLQVLNQSNLEYNPDITYFVELMNEWRIIRHQLIQKAKTHQSLPPLMQKQAYPHLQKIEVVMQQFTQLANQKIDSFIEHINAQARHTVFWALVILVVALIIARWLFQAAKAFRQEEARYQAIVEGQTELVCRFLPDATLTFVNEAFCHYFAIHYHEALSKKMFDFIPMNHHPAVSDIIQNLLQHPKENHITYEHEGLMNGNKTVWQQWTIRAILDDDNKIIEFQSVGLDITQRKNAEHILRESQLRLAEAQRIAHLGNWTWDLITGEEQWSEEMFSIFGLNFAQDSFTHETFEKALHPKDKSAVLQTFERAIDYHEPYNIEFRIVHCDGNIRHIQAFGKLIRDTGRPVRLIGTAQDITERKRAEKALSESEAHLKAIFESAAVGIVLTDAEEHFFQCNATWLEMTGYTRKELCKLTYSEITHPDDDKNCRGYYKSLVVGFSSNYRVEKRLIRKDGSYFWADVSVTVIYDQNQQFEAAIGVIVDIDERKQAETKLKTAKETAEIANRAKSTFLANMSHELRTPLNAILGYAQVFQRDTRLSNEQREGIEIIHRNGEYLLTLISDILDLAKIEADRVELYDVAFRLDEFLEDIVKLFQIRAEQKEIQFDYQKLSPLPTIVYADDKRLRQILINLLSNAVKFTQQGHVALKITYQQNKVRFQVEDTGIGIAENEIDKIFLPFQQVGDPNYRAQGTGLGLSITKKLVEMMSGKLQVESNLGQGSLFLVELDLPEGQEPIQKTETVDNLLPIQVSKTNALSDKDKLSTPAIIDLCEEHSVGKNSLCVPFNQTYKVLIVDDQIENRCLLRKLLQPLSLEIIEAANGQQAITKTLQLKPDLILMDLMMPNTDGFEATRQIRQTVEIAHTVIIAISASAFDYHRQRSLDAGCNDFLAKPLHSETLFNCLEKYITIQRKKIIETSSTTDVLTTVTLSPEQAATLLELSRRGDLKGILYYVETLKQQQPDLAAFAEKVQQLAKQLKMKQITELTNKYLAN